MTTVGHIHISPALINTSCAWAGERHELAALFDSPHTGAVTVRTATMTGFAEDPTQHTVAFASNSASTLNSYGYSPHPLSTYLAWILDIFRAHPNSTKPFIISITSSIPSELSTMVDYIQQLRVSLDDMAPSKPGRIAIELNTSCPNIIGKPPPSYDMLSLLPLLKVLADHHREDPTLTIGMKLPPYVYARQFVDVVAVITTLTHEGRNPITFLTCTNTLGSSLFFEDQVTEKAAGDALQFALPTPLGGLAGEALHPLALGNVYSFTRLLAGHLDPAVQTISVIGVGGVLDAAGRQRMLKAGAKVVGCATLLGKEGVDGFARL